MDVERSAEASTTGMGSAGSYDVHSEYQRRVIEAGDALVRRAVGGLDLQARSAVTIVDYGAGTGATSVRAMLGALGPLRERAADVPVATVHNDVITSDFSQLFRNVAAPDGYLSVPGGPVYPLAAAGSFFRQVMPAGAVDLGMCSNAAYWLREQPHLVTRNGMYFADADGAAREALAAQAAEDWAAFLEARAAELAPGGRMVVQGIGTTAAEDGRELASASRLLAVMWQTAVDLVEAGTLDADTLGGYVFPAYCRSVEESTAPCRAGAPLAGSLEVLSATVDEVPSPYWEQFERDGDAEAYAESYVAFVRAFAESTLLEHLFEPGAVGVDAGAACDEYFERLRSSTAADPAAGRYEAWVVRLMLERRAP